MPKKDTALKIIPLGGLDGIGKNMTVIEYGDDMILDDAGLMFPDDNHPGVDLILPDYTYVLENEDKENVAELYIADDDTVIIGKDLMEGLDSDLNVFLEKLLG